MIVKIDKWGNSLGLRMPSSIAKNLGLRAGSTVELEVLGDHLVLRLCHKPTLERIVSGITDSNRHAEAMPDKEIGHEIW